MWLHMQIGNVILRETAVPYDKYFIFRIQEMLTKQLKCFENTAFFLSSSKENKRVPTSLLFPMSFIPTVPTENRRMPQYGS